MGLKKKIMNKLRLEKTMKFKVEDEIITVKCNITDLLLGKPPEEACEIVKIEKIKKKEKKQEEKQKQ